MAMETEKQNDKLIEKIRILRKSLTDERSGHEETKHRLKIAVRELKIRDEIIKEHNKNSGSVPV